MISPPKSVTLYHSTVQPNMPVQYQQTGEKLHSSYHVCLKHKNDPTRMIPQGPSGSMHQLRWKQAALRDETECDEALSLQSYPRRRRKEGSRKRGEIVDRWRENIHLILLCVCVWHTCACSLYCVLVRLYIIAE